MQYLTEKSEIRCSCGAQLKVKANQRKYTIDGEAILCVNDVRKAEISPAECPLNPAAGTKKCSGVAAILMGQSRGLKVAGETPVLSTLLVMTDGGPPNFARVTSTSGDSSVVYSPVSKSLERAAEAARKQTAARAAKKEATPTVKHKRFSLRLRLDLDAVDTLTKYNRATAQAGDAPRTAVCVYVSVWPRREGRRPIKVVLPLDGTEKLVDLEPALERDAEDAWILVTTSPGFTQLGELAPVRAPEPYVLKPPSAGKAYEAVTQGRWLESLDQVVSKMRGEGGPQPPRAAIVALNGIADAGPARTWALVRTPIAVHANESVSLALAPRFPALLSAKAAAMQLEAALRTFEQDRNADPKWRQRVRLAQLFAGAARVATPYDVSVEGDHIADLLRWIADLAPERPHSRGELPLRHLPSPGSPVVMLRPHELILAVEARRSRVRTEGLLEPLRELRGAIETPDYEREQKAYIRASPEFSPCLELHGVSQAVRGLEVFLQRHASTFNNEALVANQSLLDAARRALCHVEDSEDALQIERSPHYSAAHVHAPEELIDRREWEKCLIGKENFPGREGVIEDMLCKLAEGIAELAEELLNKDVKKQDPRLLRAMRKNGVLASALGLRAQQGIARKLASKLVARSGVDRATIKQVKDLIAKSDQNFEISHWRATAHWRLTIGVLPIITAAVQLAKNLNDEEADWLDIATNVNDWAEAAVFLATFPVEKRIVQLKASYKRFRGPRQVEVGRAMWGHKALSKVGGFLSIVGLLLDAKEAYDTYQEGDREAATALSLSVAAGIVAIWQPWFLVPATLFALWGQSLTRSDIEREIKAILDATEFGQVGGPRAWPSGNKNHAAQQFVLSVRPVPEVTEAEVALTQVGRLELKSTIEVAPLVAPDRKTAHFNSANPLEETKPTPSPSPSHEGPIIVDDRVCQAPRVHFVDPGIAVTLHARDHVLSGTKVEVRDNELSAGSGAALFISATIACLETSDDKAKLFVQVGVSAAGEPPAPHVVSLDDKQIMWADEACLLLCEVDGATPKLFKAQVELEADVKKLSLVVLNRTQRKSRDRMMLSGERGDWSAGREYLITSPGPYGVELSAFDLSKGATPKLLTRTLAVTVEKNGTEVVSWTSPTKPIAAEDFRRVVSLQPLSYGVFADGKLYDMRFRR